MTTARAQQVDLAATPYYHCVNRCVRRAFLCGEDSHSGQNYDHRKQWVVDQLAKLASIFAVDICAYAVMSNHYHVVLRIAVERAEAWTDAEVAERWYQLFKGNLLVDRWRKGDEQSPAELAVVDECLTLWRARLRDVSWFMRCLNEHIARLANAEDGCKGRFWEGRFKSQALLDDVALLNAMVYVDLNPVRAGLSTSLEDSAFTSIQQRIRQYSAPAATESSEPILSTFGGEGLRQDHAPAVLPYGQQDYFELVDWTGRALRTDKRGAIPVHAPRLLNTLGLDRGAWLGNVKYFNRRFPRLAGLLERMREHCAATGRKYACGVGSAMTANS